MTQGFSFLFQYLKKQHINIDKGEFNFQVQSHPDYPSLLAVSDTLSFFKINNIAARIDTETNLSETLPNDFIALMNDKAGQFLAFVERVQNGYQFKKEEKIINVSDNEFDAIFGKVVLLAEKPVNDSVTSKKQTALYISFLVLGIIYLSSLFINGFSFPTFLFVLLAFTGVYLSIEAISHELGINTRFSEAVCNFTVNTDCDAVINSTKSKLFDFFSFSDVSITFFIGQLLALLFLSIADLKQDFYNFTFLSLLCSLPVTTFSIYLQKFVAKKWCPICLSIIILLYLETIGVWYFNNVNSLINGVSIIYYSLALITSFILSTTIKKLFKNISELKSRYAEVIRFKRNYSVFKATLLASDKVSSDNIQSGNIILGNPDAHLNIKMVTSPFCGYCKEAHSIIEKILESSSDKVAVHIRFNLNAEFLDEESKTVHQKLINIYFGKGADAFIKAMHDWFLEKDVEKLGASDTIDTINSNLILSEQYAWNQKNKTNFTPAIIINDYLFPTQYNREDLVSFIHDLADDEEF